VKSVIDKFREKYGAKDVKKYYSKFDVTVVIEIGCITNLGYNVVMHSQPPGYVVTKPRSSTPRRSRRLARRDPWTNPGWLKSTATPQKRSMGSS
jgi:hypothetical protein